MKGKHAAGLVKMLNRRIWVSRSAYLIEMVLRRIEVIDIVFLVFVRRDGEDPLALRDEFVHCGDVCVGGGARGGRVGRGGEDEGRDPCWRGIYVADMNVVKSAPEQLAGTQTGREAQGQSAAARGSHPNGDLPFHHGPQARPPEPHLVRLPSGFFQPLIWHELREKGSVLRSSKFGGASTPA